MSESDVKMEDAEKIHDESGNIIQESECKLIGDKVECQEEVSPRAAALGDVNGGENGGDDLNKVMNEDKDKMDVKTVVEDQTKPVNEASEPIQGSDCGIPIVESVNKELVSTETPVEAQVTATSGVEKQGSVENEVVEHDATNFGVKEDEPAKNNMVDSDHGKNVEEKHNEDLVENPKGIAAEAQIAATSEVEKQGDVENEVVEHDATNSGVKEDEPTKNHVVDGNHEKIVEERPSEDLVEKPEEIDKDTCNNEHVAGETMMKDADAGNVPSQDRQLLTEFPASKDPQGQDAELDDVRPGEDEEMKDAVHVDQDKMVKEEEQGAESFLVSHENDGNEKSFDTAAKPDTEESSLTNQQEPFTPNSLARCSSAKNADHSGETAVTGFTQAALPFMGEDDEGTPEEQAAFMKELDHFYRERTVDFKPPKFYGQPLNCLKLWRAVIRLGGYDRVTGSKLWRQVGESFHPPKTCTTVSWTFRIFYEKSLLEYERHKTQSGELQLPTVILPEVSGADVEGNGYQGSGSGPGRARRDAASRAMQGWHAQRLLGTGEVGEPTIKDKNLNNLAKNEKNLKSIGSLKQKRPNEVEHSNKAARTDTSKQLVPSVVDVGPPADWVKINVRQTKDCFEVYALVPGLLREEVRVQSDPAGRLVITGQPEQVDNPWGITPFKKVISLPARIHPVQTSAVVSLHGRLFVRIPFEQPSI